jgi:hypothetical protein
LKSGGEEPVLAELPPIPTDALPEEVQETTTGVPEEVGTTNVNNESWNQEEISSGVPQLPIPDGKQVYPWLVWKSFSSS